MNTKPLFTSWAVLVIAFLVAAGTASGDEVTVTLNTSPLTTLSGTSAGPFSLAFQLLQGSQPNNNTATITDFTYGVGGSAESGCPAALSSCTFGGASGGVSGSVSLNTSSAFNALIGSFTPGNWLSFHLDLTTNVDTGGTPDAFAFSILESSGGSIPTLDPTGADTLLTISIDSANPAILTYATDSSRNTLGGIGPSITMEAPIVTPEPGTLSLLTTGILFAGTLLLRRKKMA